jgi:putative ABC transport system substrate-binding protein
VKGLRDGHRSLGVQLQILETRGPAEIEPALQSLAREGTGAVLALADPMLFTHRRRLADLAIKHRLPLMGSPLGYVEAGGLMSYWADQTEQYRRVASYVDRILKGAKPGDRPDDPAVTTAAGGSPDPVTSPLPFRSDQDAERGVVNDRRS